MFPIFRRFIYRSIISVAKSRQQSFPDTLKQSPSCSGGRLSQVVPYSTPRTHTDVRDLTKEEWAKKLTPEQFSVCREQCTEPPFSGEYNSHYEPGMYSCVACGVDLFSSEAKYDSGTGWPSFYEAYETSPDHSNVIERPENSADFVTFRTEVICRKCDSHLGHVFDDGPKPTGKRYCINSVSLKFTPK